MHRLGRLTSVPSVVQRLTNLPDMVSVAGLAKGDFHAMHNAVNSIIHHALAAAKLPSQLEPTGLHRADGRCPDGMTMVP